MDKKILVKGGTPKPSKHHNQPESEAAFVVEVYFRTGKTSTEDLTGHYTNHYRPREATFCQLVEAGAQLACQGDINKYLWSTITKCLMGGYYDGYPLELQSRLVAILYKQKKKWLEFSQLW